MDAPPIQYARTEDGVNIAYWTLGEGPPQIEQPQAPYSHCECIWQVSWAPNWFTHLAARRQIVFFDHRGHGLSDREVSDYSPDAPALDIAAVADRLGLDRFDLLGAGYPSAGAILFAADHPGRIRLLALWQPLAHGHASHNTFNDLLPLIDKDFDYYVEGALRWRNPDLTPQEVCRRACVHPPVRRSTRAACGLRGLRAG
jgi:pimeloyl-ACP methyl ester carboxylesterase